MKRFLLGLFSVAVLFNYMSQLAPFTLEAHAQYKKEFMLTNQMAGAITANANGTYSINSKKIKEYYLYDKVNDLQQIVDGANFGTIQVETMSISLTTLIMALVTVGLTWLANLILDYGLYKACSWYGQTMYRFSIQGLFNPASFWFYDICRMKAWL